LPANIRASAHSKKDAGLGEAKKKAQHMATMEMASLAIIRDTRNTQGERVSFGTATCTVY
jgi:hypothetical protein